jgi:7-carboxy-7-deazaguanine synthase
MVSEKLNTNNSLKVSEYFYSIQGEGKSAGAPSIFIRLTACNLLCEGSWVCDTIDVWRKGNRMSFADIVDAIPNFYEILEDGGHLIFTGGEPLLQQQSIYLFLHEIFFHQSRPHPYVEIETNATIKPTSFLLGVINQWNLSPKLSTSGTKLYDRYDELVLDWFDKNINPVDIQWKFVVAKIEDDWNEIQSQFIDKFQIKNRNIVLMPAASTIDDLDKMSIKVANLCMKKRVWFGNRLQIQLWNMTTGV